MPGSLSYVNKRYKVFLQCIFGFFSPNLAVKVKRISKFVFSRVYKRVKQTMFKLLSLNRSRIYRDILYALKQIETLQLFFL